MPLPNARADIVDAQPGMASGVKSLMPTMIVPERSALKLATSPMMETRRTGVWEKLKKAVTAKLMSPSMPTLDLPAWRCNLSTDTLSMFPEEKPTRPGK